MLLAKLNSLFVMIARVVAYVQAETMNVGTIVRCAIKIPGASVFKSWNNFFRLTSSNSFHDLPAKLQFY